MASIVIFLLLIISHYQILGFAYDGPDGPANWPELFPPCGGLNQSPIDLKKTENSKPIMEPLKFKGYDRRPSSVSVVNNGHSAQVNFAKPPAIVYGGGLPAGGYVLTSFNFHWGSDNTKGSEHTVDSERYPMEMHLVHYKATYRSVAEAVKHADGLAVLAIFVDISEKDNFAIAPVADAVNSVKKFGSPSQSFNFAGKLGSILPSNTTSFFRYNGSLTTPTCNEAVTWTVFTEPISISEKQLKSFRSLTNEEGQPLVDNFRPIQNLNSRNILATF